MSGHKGKLTQTTYSAAMSSISSTNVTTTNRPMFSQQESPMKETHFSSKSIDTFNRLDSSKTIDLLFPK